MAVLDIIAKILLYDYSVFQLTFLRGLFSLIILAMIGLKISGIKGFKTKIQIPKYRGKKHKTVSKFSYKLGFRRQTAKILAGSSGDDQSALRFSKQWNNLPTCQNNFLTCQNNSPTYPKYFLTCQNNFLTCLINFTTYKWIHKKCHSLTRGPERPFRCLDIQMSKQIKYCLDV